ncbi:retrovirus-related pol polyprotein from transposon TNT 1-94 [Tanacetum coccineum]
MQDCKPISIPFPTNVKLSSKMSPSSEKERMEMSQVPYASTIAVGNLMFAMICIRPDIAHAVGVVSRYMAEPSREHWEAVKRILIYIKGTSDVALCFGDSDSIVKGYVDSDYACDLDGSKSTIGYVFTLSGGTVSWVSKLQSVVAMSTTEAEYVAAAQASKEASALYLARNPAFHSKTKHIQVQYHFVCEKVEEGTVYMQKIHTDDNVEDYLTKAINRDKFIWCRSSCGLAETCNDHELKIIGIGSIMVKMHDGGYTKQDHENYKRRACTYERRKGGCKLIPAEGRDNVGREASLLTCQVIEFAEFHGIQRSWTYVRTRNEDSCGEEVNSWPHKGDVGVPIKKKSDSVCLKFSRLSRSGLNLILENEDKSLRMDNGVELKETMENVDGKAGNYKAGSKIQKMLVLESNDSSEAVPQHEVNETDESQAPATQEGEPSTLQEALNNPDASFRKEAMQEEIEALHKNKTWELVPLPGGRKPIGNKWIKRNGDDQVERYCARLVVKGYAQKEGINYNEIFSPVVRMTTIRVVLAMCATYDLHLEQLDVKTEFLHENLEEEIYMLQPEGFKQKGKENLICRLNKSLYGFKQAPRCWYKRFDSFIKSLEYNRLHADPCAYFKRFGNNDFIILLLYVDDMLVAGPNKDRINKLKAQLAREFEMKDLGPANRF